MVPQLYNRTAGFANPAVLVSKHELSYFNPLEKISIASEVSPTEEKPPSW